VPPIVLTTISPAEGGTTPPSPSPQTTLPPVEYPPQTPETLTFGSSLITTQNETAEVIIKNHTFIKTKIRKKFISGDKLKNAF